MADSNPSIVCSDCGAPISAGQQRCWLCQRKTATGEAENPYASPRPVAGENLGTQFSLASLFLVMTLVAVCLGLFMVAPGLGVLFAIVATPALVRTTFTASYYKQAGSPLTPAWKIKAFLVSLFIMLAIGLAAFVAFQVVCWTGALLTQGNMGFPNVGVGIVVGLAAAVPVMIWLLWRLWPSKEAILLDSQPQKKS